MCNKLGKKARKEIFGVDPVNLFRDENGKIRRGRNGRPIQEGYMSRMLSAWHGLCDRLKSDQSPCYKKVTKANQEYLDKLDNYYLYGSNRPGRYDYGHRVRIDRNLRRNHVTKIKR